MDWPVGLFSFSWQMAGSTVSSRLLAHKIAFRTRSFLPVGICRLLNIFSSEATSAAVLFQRQFGPVSYRYLSQ